jgi:hypothetical protein
MYRRCEHCQQSFRSHHSGRLNRLCFHCILKLDRIYPTLKHELVDSGKPPLNRLHKQQLEQLAQKYGISPVLIRAFIRLWLAEGASGEGTCRRCSHGIYTAHTLICGACTCILDAAQPTDPEDEDSPLRFLLFSVR